jgi:hypothetical protein
MSEDEARRSTAEESQDEVEAHRAVKSANDEGEATEGSDDDFEAHRALKNRPGKTA